MQFLKVAKDAVWQTEFAKEMQGTVSKSNTRRCFNRVQFLKVMQVALSKEGGMGAWCIRGQELLLWTLGQGLCMRAPLLQPLLTNPSAPQSLLYPVPKRWIPSKD